MSTFCFVLADGPFIDAPMVQEHAKSAGIELRVLPLDTPAETAASTQGADAVLVVTNPLTREIIDAMAASVRVIGRAGVGLDAIDLEAAAERGLGVFHTPDYCVEEVATHTVALILALARQIVAGDAVARAKWVAWRDLTPLPPLHEQRAGVVGLGRIGRAVSARLAPLVGEVWAFDPETVDPPGDVHAVDTLEELLTSVDVVTLHLPLTPETERLIDAHALAMMKPTAHLVNVSRGGLIDEKALTAALKNGAIAGAALDVLAEEPPAPGAPLLNERRVVLSPHFAWYSTGSESRVWDSTMSGIQALLEGREPESGRVALPLAAIEQAP
jgi:D-3-phosphoglycerate dehydrogenase